MLSRLRLSAALIAFVVVPLTFMIGAVGSVGLSVLERQAEARMREDIELIARALQFPLSRAIQRGEPYRMQEMLRSAFSFGRVYGVHVFGREGQLVAGAGAGARALPAREIQALALRGEEGSEYTRVDGEALYVYFLPLSDAGGRFAALLQITRHADDFRDTLALIRGGGAIGLGLLALLLSAVVIIGHRWAIGGPLRELSRSMEAVATGARSHRARPGGPAEIRELARGFNSMLESLARSEAEIARRRERQESLEADLRESRKLAAVGELAAGVAHELGTPLSVVDGRAQRALRRSDLAPPVREALESTRGEVQRMSRIVRELMDFARRSPLRPRRLEVRPMLAGVIERAQAMPEAAGARLALDDGGEGLTLHADPTRLEEALANLVQNALQASPGGEIRVGVAQHGAECVLRVDDDGPGIDPNARERLFEPFFTSKPVGSGTGLGLAVVHGAVEAHGGRIRVGESPLGGARFEIILPAEGRAAEAKEAEHE